MPASRTPCVTPFESRTVQRVAVRDRDDAHIEHLWRRLRNRSQDAGYCDEYWRCAHRRHGIQQPRAWARITPTLHQRFR